LKAHSQETPLLPVTLLLQRTGLQLLSALCRSFRCCAMCEGFPQYIGGSGDSATARNDCYESTGSLIILATHEAATDYNHKKSFTFSTTGHKMNGIQLRDINTVLFCVLFQPVFKAVSYRTVSCPFASGQTQRYITSILFFSGCHSYCRCRCFTHAYSIYNIQCIVNPYYNKSFHPPFSTISAMFFLAFKTLTIFSSIVPLQTISM
jgi:hypothetical protein